jgi:hypothetical protein
MYDHALYTQAKEDAQGYAETINTLTGNINDNVLAMAETPVAVQQMIDTYQNARTMNNA